MRPTVKIKTLFGHNHMPFGHVSWHIGLDQVWLTGSATGPLKQEETVHRIVFWWARHVLPTPPPHNFTPDFTYHNGFNWPLNGHTRHYFSFVYAGAKRHTSNCIMVDSLSHFPTQPTKIKRAKTVTITRLHTSTPLWTRIRLAFPLGSDQHHQHFHWGWWNLFTALESNSLI